MSATTVQNNTRTFVAGEALDAYLIVFVQSDGTVVKATGGENEPKVGFTVAPIASGAVANISLLHGGGTSYGLASGVIAIGDVVFAAAGGKLTAATGGNAARAGFALTAATADGDVIEVIAYPN
tara:strand:+ start:4656 stop:5027 length:372 start_codon:yes stop_codon:yes gene_type:complete